jgi:RNA polymerase sigma-70 factor (ECF subfamily)
VARAQAGDDEAFTTLVERYQDRVYRLTLRLTRSPEEARDATQDTFLTLVRKLGSFRGESAFGSWLYRVAANAALLRLRKRKNHPEVLAEDPGVSFDDAGKIAGEVVDFTPQAEELAQSAELREKLEEAVARLPEPYRLVFLLRDVEERSTEEVAEILGLSLANVKTRLHRARLALRKLLAEHSEKR